MRCLGPNGSGVKGSCKSARFGSILRETKMILLGRRVVCFGGLVVAAGVGAVQAQQGQPPLPPMPSVPSHERAPLGRDGRWLLVNGGGSPSFWVDTERTEGLDPTGTRHRLWVRQVFSTPQVDDLWRGKKVMSIISQIDFECANMSLRPLTLTAYDSTGASVYDGRTDEKKSYPPPGSRGETMLRRVCSSIASGELARHAP